MGGCGGGGCLGLVELGGVGGGGGGAGVGRGTGTGDGWAGGWGEGEGVGAVVRRFSFLLPREMAPRWAVGRVGIWRGRTG